MTHGAFLMAFRFVFVAMSIACLSALGLNTAQAQSSTSFSTLEERMTGQEFRDTGLHKLTDEELQALNQWIRQRSLAEGDSLLGERVADGATATPSSDRRGFDTDRGDRRPIRSRIVGEFTGWEGNTEFELENGMVWRQAEPARLIISPIENPSVTIEPGLLGSWRLGVDGRNQTVRVRRIR